MRNQNIDITICNVHTQNGTDLLSNKMNILLNEKYSIRNNLEELLHNVLSIKKEKQIIENVYKNTVKEYKDISCLFKEKLSCLFEQKVLENEYEYQEKLKKLNYIITSLSILKDICNDVKLSILNNEDYLFKLQVANQLFLQLQVQIEIEKKKNIPDSFSSEINQLSDMITFIVNGQQEISLLLKEINDTLVINQYFDYSLDQTTACLQSESNEQGYIIEELEIPIQSDTQIPESISKNTENNTHITQINIQQEVLYYQLIDNFTSIQENEKLIKKLLLLLIGTDKNDKSNIDLIVCKINNLLDIINLKFNNNLIDISYLPSEQIKIIQYLKSDFLTEMLKIKTLFKYLKINNSVSLQELKYLFINPKDFLYNNLILLKDTNSDSDNLNNQGYETAIRYELTKFLLEDNEEDQDFNTVLQDNQNTFYLLERMYNKRIEKKKNRQTLKTILINKYKLNDISNNFTENTTHTTVNEQQKKIYDEFVKQCVTINQELCTIKCSIRKDITENINNFTMQTVNHYNKLLNNVLERINTIKQQNISHFIALTQKQQREIDLLYNYFILQILRTRELTRYFVGKILYIKDFECLLNYFKYNYNYATKIIEIKEQYEIMNQQWNMQSFVLQVNYIQKLIKLLLNPIEQFEIFEIINIEELYENKEYVSSINFVHNENSEYTKSISESEITNNSAIQAKQQELYSTIMNRLLNTSAKLTQIHDSINNSIKNGNLQISKIYKELINIQGEININIVLDTTILLQAQKEYLIGVIYNTQMHVTVINNLISLFI